MDLAGGVHIKLARELKERCHRLYRLDMAHDYFEHWKDSPLPEFLGISPRRAYIEFHERYLKPVHGAEVLGRLLIDREERSARMLRVTPIWSRLTNAIVSDAGQKEQCLPLVRAWGADRVTLIRLHREGVSWNDNREPINLEAEGARMVFITNPGDSVENLTKVVRDVLPEVLGSSTPA
jgi:hypothetical protein